MEHKKLVQRFERAHEGKLKCAAICTKQKKLLITGSQEGDVNVWLLSKPDPITILKGQQTPISCVTSHPKESYIAAGSTNGTVKIYDLAQDGKAVRTFGCVEGTSCVGIEFHPLVDILAVMSSDHTINLWDFRQRRCIKQIASDQNSLQISVDALNVLPALQFSPDGKWFCYSTISDNDNLLHVWDLSAGEEIQALAHPCDEGMICELVFHPQHMVMVTGTKAGCIRVWDMTTFQNLCSFSPLKQTQGSLSDGIRMIFNNEGNALFVYKDSWMERIFCASDFQLQTINTIRSESNQIPSHILRSGSSLISLCCDTPSSFSLWVTNSTISTTDIPIPITQKTTIKPLSDHTNTLDVSKPKEQPKKPNPTKNLLPAAPVLAVLPKNQRIVKDRQNCSFALDLKSFCTQILSNDSSLSEEKLLADLIGDPHKQFCGALNTRTKVIKPLMSLTKKADVPGILTLFTRSKNIDLAMLAVCIDSCTYSMDKKILQLDHLGSFNSLLLLLLNSGENRFIRSALLCLLELVTSYGTLLRSSRPNKLRESLQKAQQLSQDSSVSMELRVAGRNACRSYTDKHNR